MIKDHFLCSLKFSKRAPRLFAMVLVTLILGTLPKMPKPHGAMASDCAAHHSVNVVFEMNTMVSYDGSAALRLPQLDAAGSNIGRN